MNKEEFNKLDIENQVKEFNNLYKQIKSARKVFGRLGFAKSTLSDRFRNGGYTLVNNIGYVRNTNTPVTTKPIVKKPVDEHKHETNIKELEQVVNSIVTRKIEEALKTRKSNSIESIELSSKCDGEVKYRAMGAYKEVIDEFVEYCKGKRYTQIELFSQAMIEFMERHP